PGDREDVLQLGQRDPALGMPPHALAEPADLAARQDVGPGAKRAAALEALERSPQPLAPRREHLVGVAVAEHTGQKPQASGAARAAPRRRSPAGAPGARERAGWVI